MDSLVLVIALLVAASSALVVYHVYMQTTYSRRVVAARLSSVDTGLGYSPSAMLRERRSRIPFVSLLPISAEAGERMRVELLRAGWRIRVGEYLGLRVACALVAPVVAIIVLDHVAPDAPSMRALGAGVAVLVGWMLPRFYLSNRRQARLNKIEQQLPDALLAIAKSLRVGAGILQGLTYA